MGVEDDYPDVPDDAGEEEVHGPVCRYCGDTDVQWGDHDGRRVLLDANGEVHPCGALFARVWLYDIRERGRAFFVRFTAAGQPVCYGGSTVRLVNKKVYIQQWVLVKNKVPGRFIDNTDLIDGSGNRRRNPADHFGERTETLPPDIDRLYTRVTELETQVTELQGAHRDLVRQMTDLHMAVDGMRGGIENLARHADEQDQRHVKIN